MIALIMLGIVMQQSIMLYALKYHKMQDKQFLIGEPVGSHVWCPEVLYTSDHETKIIYNCLSGTDPTQMYEYTSVRWRVGSSCTPPPPP